MTRTFEKLKQENEDWEKNWENCSSGWSIGYMNIHDISPIVGVSLKQPTDELV